MKITDDRSPPASGDHGDTANSRPAMISITPSR
jgi:hypothetical protein